MSKSEVPLTLFDSKTARQGDKETRTDNEPRWPPDLIIIYYRSRTELNHLTPAAILWSHLLSAVDNLLCLPNFDRWTASYWRNALDVVSFQAKGLFATTAAKRNHLIRRLVSSEVLVESESLARMPGKMPGEVCRVVSVPAAETSVDSREFAAYKVAKNAENQHVLRNPELSYPKACIQQWTPENLQHMRLRRTQSINTCYGTRSCRPLMPMFSSGHDESSLRIEPESPMHCCAGDEATRTGAMCNISQRVCD